MTGRPLMLATLLGASIGVPYVVSTSSSHKSAPNSAPASATTASNAHSVASSPPLLPASTASNYTSYSPAPTIYPTTATPAALTGFANPNTVPGERFHSLQEVLRFDVTKEWVYQNWDRKSTGLGDPQLFGIRVALVTGMQRTDLAGALTYWFDNQGQVQRISFRGRTADTTSLIQFLMQTYQLERKEAPPGEQLYQVRSGRDVYSELRTRPESVLLTETPYGSFGVVLELGRPGSKRPLKPEVPPLDIPPAATPPTKEVAKDAKDAKDGAAQPALVGEVRPATQTEHNQLFEHRWPN